MLENPTPECSLYRPSTVDEWNQPIENLPVGTIVWDPRNAEAAMVNSKGRDGHTITWADGLVGCVGAGERFEILRKMS